jgi:hypothetical protein
MFFEGRHEVTSSSTTITQDKHTLAVFSELLHSGLGNNYIDGTDSIKAAGALYDSDDEDGHLEASICCIPCVIV